ncbi:hypothetical protein GCM10011332_28060 [Terasakiella brassicae]|uniref:Carboxyvinyl-carboxyphosphonate phosphorylmutase n=1 Tax=Terasakiella brassicae TaxID=1634917 RepID=A0A917C505_9PROT|nr:isocitrate lyase/PEP mutase family protein [Terasakiella brassicae]GGF72489.1 hypothetical protein GCM10011332_28060 [Terasakiella brassicae]
MSTASNLRALLAGDDFLMMPCCFDGLSATLIERAGYPLTFMSGFSVSAARLGMPDTGLISYGEMVDQGRSICQATALPVIGDGDTGYGNALNVKRTVQGYAQAGFAGIMIEDQLSPKRCGHTKGKQTVGFDEACMRIQAAVDARNEGADILIMARTDARQTEGLDEAIRRMKAFEKIGADILFLEAPQSVDEMTFFCQEVKGAKMANMVEQGKTPVLPPMQLAEMGYKIAAYPLTLILSAVQAMETALEELKGGYHPKSLASFEHLQEVIGFPDYYQNEERYKI